MKVTLQYKQDNTKHIFTFPRKKTFVTNCFRLHSSTEKLAHNPLNHQLMAYFNYILSSQEYKTLLYVREI